MKRLLSLTLLLCSLPALGALETLDSSRDLNSMLLALPQKNIITRNIHEPLNVFHDRDGFIVAHNAQITRVKSYDVTPELRKMDVEQAAKLLAATQIRVVKLSNGEFTVTRHRELKGGGVGGAAIGFYCGKAIVYIGGHGAIIAAGIASGPLAFVATVASLEAQFAAPIEAASTQVGLGAGMLLAVATGPV